MKTEVVSFRASPYQRARLGAYARRTLKKAGVEISTKKRDQISLFMGCVTKALLDGKLRFSPSLIIAHK